MEQKYIYFFIAFVILIVILYFAGYNVMNAYQKNNEIMNNKINNLNTKLNNKIIHKKLSLNSNNINVNDNNINVNDNNIDINDIDINDINGINDNSNGIGVLRDPNWRKKVENHMNYQHGNPFMYNKPVKVLYDDL